MADNNETERKTVKTDEESLADRLKQKVEVSSKKNVLNSYRSATYNFTLSALRKSLVDKPDEIRKTLDLVILRSGGKGSETISSKVEGIERKTSDVATDELGNRNVRLDTTGSKLAEDFNQNSPGRFDMFIDNVEIKTLMAFSEASNVTLPTNIKFEIFEPYSVNGFIEALHVSAVAAGYPSYLQASFVLKIEFIGYPDSEDLPSPEPIPESVRYFPFVFTGLEVDITERGTRYVCSAVPVEQRVFGTPDMIKKGINAEGQTVKSILEDFLKNLEDSLKNSDKEAKKSPGQGDKYAIKFPKWNPDTGFDFGNGDNKIAESEFVDIGSDSVLFSLNFPDQTHIKNDSVKKITSAKRTSAQVQFPENVKVSDAIIAVVRDSKYVRDIVEAVNPDPYGYVDYFSLRTEVKNLDTINETTGKPYQEITYIVAPYKVHYSKIPGLGNKLTNEADLKRLALRGYNYIYTGMNVDIINFKLNFNTLYFEAVPADMGNFDQVLLKNTAKRTETPDKQLNPSPAVKNPVGENPTQATSSSADYTSTKAGDSVTAGQPLSEYAAMAKAIHNSVIDSKASMITGEIEILGDPFYLVTGGMGSYNPAPMKENRDFLGEGEAPYLQKQLLINITFRNPIDINPLEKGGLVNFDSNRVPFSGVYQVTEALSTFKNGDFRQRLNILRVPGQVVDVEVRSEDPKTGLVSVENPELQPIPDTSRAEFPEQRLSETAALEILDRGTPITGLPGQLSNFTAASGGLGGSSPSLLNQSLGLASNPLSAGSAIIGKSLPSDFLSNVRLSASGLANLAQSNLGSAAIIGAAANVLTGNMPSQRLASTLASSIASAAITPVLSRSLDTTIGSASDPIGLVRSIGNNAIDAVTGLGSEAANLINNVGNKISNSLESIADPGAIAAKVGIDASKISGLASNLQSKVAGQISNLTKNIPSDVDLSRALESGLAFDFMSADSIKNIPATAPALKAPTPEINTKYISEVADRGGSKALEDLYGVTNLSQVSSNLIPNNIISDAVGNISGYQNKFLNNLPSISNPIDSTIIKDKLSTVGSQISGLTGQLKVSDLNVAGSVSSKFGSINKQSPLTKLVNNSINRA